MKLIVNTWVKVRYGVYWYDVKVISVNKDDRTFQCFYNGTEYRFPIAKVFDPNKLYVEEINEVANYLTNRGLW